MNGLFLEFLPYLLADMASYVIILDQDVPLLPPSSLRQPTRDVTPTSHQMLVGPNGQLGGPPPNCLAPIGPQMPGAMAPGGQMQLAAGGHFLQNHNQVFVFSTAMANHAALLVKSGQFKNIIDFHVNHPDTQQFLQVKLCAFLLT